MIAALPCLASARAGLWLPERADASPAEQLFPDALDLPLEAR